MIFLFTDFGASGLYVGQLRTVLADLAPSVPVIEIMNGAPSADPFRSAYLLAAYDDGLPPGSVILGVVDPGVGGERPPVAIRADGRWYVGPGNGLFDLVRRRAETVADFLISWRPAKLSASFHGRDLFAPVAARLATGQAGHDIILTDATAWQAKDWPDDLDQVIHIDPYGNAITGRRAATIAGAPSLRIAGVELLRARTFSDLPPGDGFWYENSSGLVEIAVNQGRADRVLNLTIGSPITWS